MDISCTCHQDSFLVKWPPTLLPIRVRLLSRSSVHFWTFYVISNKNIFSDLGPIHGGETPVIAGTVSFHLCFGGINLLFWQLSYENISSNRPQTHPLGSTSMHDFSL